MEMKSMVIVFELRAIVQYRVWENNICKGGVLMERYIYLDWNVVKYAISPRKSHEYFDTEIVEIVNKINKKYVFPFSEAHIRDRLNNFQEAHRGDVIRDLEFLNELTGKKAVRRKDFDDFSLVIDTIDVKQLCEALRNSDDSPVIDTQYMPQDEYKVDVNQISQDDPLYDFYIRNNGIVTPSRIIDYLPEFYERYFTDCEYYKRFRNSPFINIDFSNPQKFSMSDTAKAEELQNTLGKFRATMNSDIETIRNLWPEYLENWLSVMSRDNTVSNYTRIIYLYFLLDQHKNFRDKLKKNKNTFSNIYRDAIHAFYASEATYFVSEDVKTRGKVKFVYELLKIKTKVIDVDEFIRCFS